MVIFDVLKISDDAKEINIAAHVNMSKYYQGYTITDVYIIADTDMLEFKCNEEKAIYHMEFPEHPTEINLTIRNTDLVEDLEICKAFPRFDKRLFFVYVKCLEAVNECTACIPCGMDSKYTVGTVFDTSLFYNRSLAYIKELNNDCSNKEAFSNFILNWEGFKIFIESEHYIEAIKLFNKLFKSSQNIYNNNCGCYGKISG